MNSISGIRPSVQPLNIDELRQGSKPAQAGSAQGISFGKMLDSLSQTQAESDALIQKLAAGEEVDLHQVMIASEQSDISFRVALAIRDKLVEAYRDVMHMNV
jgi:flagellar hook-basal body complex protein FliE